MVQLSRPGVRRALVTTAITAALALAACGSGGSSQGADSGEAPSTSESAAEGTASTDPGGGPTSTSAPTTPSTPPEPTRYFPGPREAIDHLIAAWQNEDIDAALEGAQAQAALNLFTQPADGFELYGCDTGEFTTSNCNYRNRATGGFASITAEERLQGWIVTRVYSTVD